MDPQLAEEAHRRYAECKAPTVYVGIAGNRPGAGKDTAADILETARVSFCPFEDCRVVVRKFADPLRECLHLVHGVPPGESRTREGKAKKLPNGDTVGRALQKLGAAIRNTVGPDSWVRAAMRGLPTHNHLVIFGDVRYPNEAAAIKERGGIIIWVERAEASDAADALAGRDPNHESEQLTAEVADERIANDGTLDEFREAVLAVADKHHLLDVGLQ